jgi:hypothetical protein
MDKQWKMQDGGVDSGNQGLFSAEKKKGAFLHETRLPPSTGLML